VGLLDAPVPDAVRQAVVDHGERAAPAHVGRTERQVREFLKTPVLPAAELMRIAADVAADKAAHRDKPLFSCASCSCLPAPGEKRYPVVMTPVDEFVNSLGSAGVDVISLTPAQVAEHIALAPWIRSAAPVTDLPGLGPVHLYPFLCEREAVPPAAAAEGASRAPSGGDESADEPGGGGAAVPEVDVAALLRDMPPLGAAPPPPRTSLSSLTVACAVILPLLWVLLAASGLLPAPAVACAVAALFALLACLTRALAGREKGLHANRLR